MDARRNIVTKDDEKSEVVPQSLIIIIIIVTFKTLGDNQPSEPKERDGEQNETSITHGEILSVLLHHLVNKSVTGLGWDSPEGIEELVEELLENGLDFTKPSFFNSWLSRGVTDDCRLTKGTPIYKD